MYSAYDNEFKKISINDAVVGQTYFCPTCKKKLYVRTVKGKRPHFCHYPGESCIDYWDYDESKWSEKWKNSFSKEEVEIIHYEHHIDIEVKNNLGIMFSSSSMHRDTFVEKTNYMLSNISNAMWLFNLTNLYEKGTVDPKRDRVRWRNIWKMFSDYPYENRNVWIVIEIIVNGISCFGILKDIDRAYTDKTLYIRRWLKEEQFRKYFNDIADKKNPEQPYVEEEERQRKLKEEADKKARIVREKQEAIEKAKKEEAERKRKKEYEAQLKKQQEEEEREAALIQKQKEDAEKEKIRQEEAKKDYVQQCYANDPEMKRMSDMLSVLARSDDFRAFANLAEKWQKKYGFVWLRSEFYH